MKKFLILVLVVSAVSVFAQPRFARRDIMEKLNLSKEQISDIQGMRTKHQKSMIDLRADMQKLQLEKRDLMQKNDFNRKALTEVEEKIISLRSKMQMAGFNHRMDMMAVLTPEQREKVPALWKEKMNQRGGKGMRSGKGKGRGAGRGNGNFGCVGNQECINY